MTAGDDLERAYGRWLTFYPAEFRREHGAEVVGVLMAGAREGQRRPAPMECLDLVGGAVRMHLRPPVPRSDRAVFAAVRLMYLGALVELAAAITIVATAGAVRANVVAHDPGLTDAEWQVIASGQLEPKAIAAGVAVGGWLWMARALGRGRRWVRIASVIVFGLTTASLLDGLAGGSAVYAGADLAVGVVLWSVHLAVVALVVRAVAGSRSGARPTAPRG
jgi:hypothetical protein